jgi:predicted nucleic acid-binding Zn ribbon protein
MTEVVHRHHNNSQSELTKYGYMCDECGVAFNSVQEYIEHYKQYHPRSIGTAIT